MIFLLFHHSYSPLCCFSDQRFFVFLSPIWEHHESTNQAVSHPLLASCDGWLHLLQDSESLERNNENRYCKRLCQIFCIFVNIWLIIARARYRESWKEYWELITNQWLDQNMMMNTVLMMMIRAVLKGLVRTDEIKSDENRWGSTCQLGDRQTWSKEKWKNSQEPETHLRKTEKKFMNYKNKKTKKQVILF